MLFICKSALKVREFVAQIKVNSKNELHPFQEMGFIPVSLSVFSVSFEQIAVLHKRFKQLSHNEETLR